MQWDSIGVSDANLENKDGPDHVPISHQDNNFKRKLGSSRTICGNVYKLFLTCVLLTNAVICSESRRRTMPQSCSRSRQILSDEWGIVSDGPPLLNYTENTHCEWLIKPKLPNKFISLQFTSMATECSYDYVFVYDGDSLDSDLLGSFSGQVRFT